MSGLSHAIAFHGTVIAGLSTLAWASISPTNTLWGPLHCRGSGDGPPRYALTFDDGPTRGSTSAVLDLLGEFGVQAAFFVIGANARQCPDLLVRMHAEGHLIANHTLDHAHLSMFRGSRYWDHQLVETDRIIGQIIGRRPAMFRPPMGMKTGFNMGAAKRAGQAVVTWSRRAMDGIATTPERILDRLVPRTVAGDVLLLHDGVEPQSHRDPSPSIKAIKPLILRLRDRGLEPAPLDDFLGLPAYAKAPTEVSAWSSKT